MEEKNNDVNNNNNNNNNSNIVKDNTNQVNSMSGIVFSAPLKSNNNNSKLSTLSKRKEPEKKEPINYITTLEGTKVTSLYNDETSTLGSSKLKVIPLTEQLNENYENSDKIVAQVAKEIKKEEKENEKNENNNDDSSNKKLRTEEKLQPFYKASQTGLQLNPNRKQEIKSIVDGKNENSGSSSGIPLIMKLKDIDKYENETDKFKHDVESRPDESNLDDYEETPVSIIGEALLRGMGWVPGKSIGSTNKGLVEPIEYIKRPGFRLGLGAKPMDDDDEIRKMGGPIEDADGKVRHVKGINEKIVSNVKKMEEGSLVTVIGGPHKGMNAKIVSMLKNDKVQIIFKSDEKVIVDKFDLQLYDKNLTTNNNNNNSKSSSSKSSSSSSSSSSYSSSSSKSSSSTSSSSSYSTSSSSSSSSSNSVMWIRPQILVKVISKSLGDGKYYNKKATVSDILGEKLCSLHFDNGVVVENVKQSMLETAIPKVKGDLIIVRGKYKGKIGTLIERRRNKKDIEMAIVQLVGDLSVLEFDLDDICEYVGSKDIDLYN
ncbi:hypothetical protein DDB_G0289933 [Dictyostelium discoideum AX4]|uniref:G-patch domain-containing protein n=1 Tax=Dictyostelium discoideum TaxID=44689 RepID=Q54GS9_DICDI|nr:hypothetical protein DDB_G0289933 [Dictyostelium discoideum AX4]EAL62479.1 hypothetical protein DDB_G0289933 [Dictyostelium discoideum AX4]|eukprot:XP_635990.1 hypothetical protein DDB_G0289933 [Dictyostelium discoideum AX4]